MVEAFWRGHGGHAPAVPVGLPHPFLPAAGACGGGCSLARLLRSRCTCMMQCSKCSVECCEGPALCPASLAPQLCCGRMSALPVELPHTPASLNPPGRLQLLPPAVAAPGCCTLCPALLKCWPLSDAEHTQLGSAGTLHQYCHASRLNEVPSHLFYRAAASGRKQRQNDSLPFLHPVCAMRAGPAAKRHCMTQQTCWEQACLSVLLLQLQM